jgi:hypothetical protein
MSRKTGFLFLVILNVMFYCVLSFHQTSDAQMSSPRPTLSNAPEERRELVSNLEEIRNLLKEQNALLRSGQVKVIVTQLPKN